MVEMNVNSTVSYTVKELLDEQTGLLRSIDRKVDTKADKTDLVPIITELHNHDTRLTRIEEERTAAATARALRRDFRRRLSVIFTAVLVPVGTALIIVFFHP